LSLKEKTLFGLFWSFGQQAGFQGINFVVKIILARLLLPEAFGLIAMLQIFITISITLMQGGLTLSLIRTENPDQGDYSTVFFMNVLVSIGLYWILFTTAPLIANFYDQEVLTAIIRIYSLTIVIQSFAAVQEARLTKLMNFKLQTLMQIPSVIVGGGIGILMAFKGFGVWSLVWMSLATSIFLVLQYWLFSGWRPAFIIDLNKLRTHFNFGYKLALSNLIAALYQNLYLAVIGKFYPPAQLGYFYQSKNLSLYPVQNFSSALKRVTYPVFSSIQDDDERLRQVFRKISITVFAAIFPVMLFLIVFAKPVFLVLLTEKWLPAVPIFQILCIGSIFYPQSMFNLNILAAKGRSDLHLKIEAPKKIIGILLLFSLIWFSVTAVAIAYSVSLLVHAAFNIYYSGKLIQYKMIDQLKDFTKSFLVAVFVMILAWLSYQGILYATSVSVLGNLILTGIVFFTLYILLSVKYKIVNFSEILDVLKQRS
jgi:O-antigen/teichoic acid export membrane protein